MPDFTNPAYLRNGSTIQRKCYDILERSRVMELLEPYTPVVAGTIPIGIDIPRSDIDILCCCRDFGQIEKVLHNFSNHECFRCSTFERGGEKCFVCSFIFDGTEIEVFAQGKPVLEQNGYRHMITEHALLQIHGEQFRQEIIRLKQSGIKTEPAFAQLLGFNGDPYQVVLEKGREMGLY